jgi:hypothetical protein
VGFQVLMASNMKIIAFWDIAPCNLVEVDWLFRGAYCLHRPGNGGSTHLRNVYFNEITRCYIPEGCRLHLLVKVAYFSLNSHFPFAIAWLLWLFLLNLLPLPLFVCKNEKWLLFMYSTFLSSEYETQVSASGWFACGWWWSCYLVMCEGEW